jgi:hypothetical protein
LQIIDKAKVSHTQQQQQQRQRQQHADQIAKSKPKGNRNAQNMQERKRFARKSLY